MGLWKFFKDNIWVAVFGAVVSLVITDLYGNLKLPIELPNVAGSGLGFIATLNEQTLSIGSLVIGLVFVVSLMVVTVRLLKAAGLSTKPAFSPRQIARNGTSGIIFGASLLLLLHALFFAVNLTGGPILITVFLMSTIDAIGRWAAERDRVTSAIAALKARQPAPSSTPQPSPPPPAAPE